MIGARSKKKTCYIGLKHTDKENIEPDIALNVQTETSQRMIPVDMALVKDGSTTTIILPTTYLVDNKRVAVEAKITDHTWQLAVGGINIKMEKNGISTKFHPTQKN